MHTLPRARRSLLLPALLAAAIACDQAFAQDQTPSFRLDRGSPSETNSQFYHDASSSYRDSAPSQTLKLIFYPPVPPPLESFPSRRIASPTVLSAPPELGPYVSEFFYPELASLMHQGNLFSSRREALRKYHDEKRALQQELRAELVRAETLDSAARVARLSELAGIQDPKIVRLEARAEELRHELYDKDSDWSARRQWHLGEFVNLSDSASEVAQVMQAAAFFQDGLSVQQRGQLREFAVEISAGQLPGPTSPPRFTAAALPSEAIYFSPSLTRLRLPDNLPTSVQTKLRDYTRRKIALRQQLLDILRREDIPTPGRTQRFADLAAAQTAGFAELETLAEEIRRELPLSPPPAAPLPLVPLPSALTERLIAFSDRLPAVPPNPKLKDYKDSVGLQGSLGRERAALRADIVATLPPDDPSLADVAISDGPRLSLIRRAAPALAAYQIAALVPGLSPPQRRLLFDSAVEDLSQPLPNGQPQPIRRPPPSPLPAQRIPH